MDSEFHQILDEDNKNSPVSVPIAIGDHVWVGCNSMILKGASVPANSVVAANSVVLHKHNQDHVLLVNDRIVHERINWEL